MGASLAAIFTHGHRGIEGSWPLRSLGGMVHITLGPQTSRVLSRLKAAAGASALIQSLIPLPPGSIESSLSAVRAPNVTMF